MYSAHLYDKSLFCVKVCIVVIVLWYVVHNRKFTKSVVKFSDLVAKLPT